MSDYNSIAELSRPRRIGASMGVASNLFGAKAAEQKRGPCLGANDKITSG